MNTSWLLELDRSRSSYLLLASLAGLGVAAGVLYRVGLIGWILELLGIVVRGSIRKGFRLWERWLAWASWPLFVALAVGFLFMGSVASDSLPGLRIGCGLAPLFMGTIACLAYMFIDIERYEVERGHKAIHNPLKGQTQATHLARYGAQVRVPLLVAATVAIIGGFALLNQGLYDIVGRRWFAVGDGTEQPAYIDFLAYAITKLLGLLDVLDLAKSRHWLRAEFIRPAAWPASTLLAAFKAFFSLVLLQQVFASLRQGKLLAETIADFWSPHVPIHERARNALAQFGGGAIGPLLVSLRSVPSLTKEQRDQLPLVLATIGPSTIPALVRHLHDPQEHVRAVAVAALGLLHAVDTVPLLAGLSQDPCALVRQSVAQALGTLGSARTATSGVARARVLRLGLRDHAKRFWLARRSRRATPEPPRDPVELSVETLEAAFADDSAAVRTQAVQSMGRIGPPASTAVHGLIGRLKDNDETVRCEAAEALSLVGGSAEVTVTALIELLQDASGPVKAAAARALGSLNKAASPAISTLVPLLQDREESVRTAAAEAIARVGPLNEAATDTLAEGLESLDTVVRAQTAEALGTIGAAADEAAPALVEAMKDENDEVRAKAVEALGKIGETAAEAAVPGLVRALNDQDNRVSALAAEALGQMGESENGVVAALIGSLEHLNPQVRGNAAEAIGNLGDAAAGARRALEQAAQDEDSAVRGQAIRALGAIGVPTSATVQVILAGLEDADPLVRAAALESVGRWGNPGEAVVNDLIPLLDDANDGVKIEAILVLPKLAGATPAVLAGLCRRLLEDDSTSVQTHAALALGRLGPAARAAGEALLQAARTGDVSVREKAMRAITLIQPPETIEALAAGLRDACGDIRIVASAGWMRAAVIPKEAVPDLVEALRDPEVQVRANAAHALGRLDTLPRDAIPLLVERTTDADEGVRLNAATALKLAPADLVGAVMQNLLTDSNSRIRLIAAGSLLATGLANPQADLALVEALGDPAPESARPRSNWSNPSPQTTAHFSKSWKIAKAERGHPIYETP
ncbi:HEAT repeat [Singulisphaera sp. GP187]|uniref:HEAT repeat domain-containing protein n=1 Tax=Singulisphaera sp. GP187 TaxID=1882752 RepID=UPI0009294107|nr:HEAT repeat domain-containing protein [Singulisphaera sp. GP187]SIN87371.1 HEAT repeat [Singulisphaera sp. GP187]